MPPFCLISFLLEILKMEYDSFSMKSEVHNPPNRLCFVFAKEVRLAAFLELKRFLTLSLSQIDEEIAKLQQ